MLTYFLTFIKTTVAAQKLNLSPDRNTSAADCAAPSAAVCAADSAAVWVEKGSAHGDDERDDDADGGDGIRNDVPSVAGRSWRVWSPAAHPAKNQKKSLSSLMAVIIPNPT